MFLTSTISGLFSFVDTDLAHTPWLPKFLQQHPFLIGFLLLNVPVSTVSACKAALQVYDAERIAKNKSKA